MRAIDVITPAGQVETVLSLAEQHCEDHWVDAGAVDGRQAVHMLVSAENSQKVLDGLQVFLGSAADARVIVSSVEATLPAFQERAEESKPGAKGIASSREELLSEMEKGSRLDRNFLVLVFLSTIVAAIGLIEDNVAVVIGAMVIAPLLGPNLALALGSALGDRELTWRALKTGISGVFLAFIVSVLIGMFWNGPLYSQELMTRTSLGLDSLALALASGLAAALSLTTGLSSVLVGVMVAVALLPPTSTAGIMLGHGEYSLAVGAGMLLLANVVCVNLAAKLIFLYKGVRPRTWLEKQKARQSFLLYLIIWVVSLLILVAIIYARS